MHGTKRLKQSPAVTHTHKREFVKLEKQIETLLDRLVETSTPSAVVAYEKRLEKLERDKLVLIEKTEKQPVKDARFDDFSNSLCHISQALGIFGR